MSFEYFVPCLFGLEGIVADELRYMDIDDVEAKNGHVIFKGDGEAMARANLNMRCGERVLMQLAEFKAVTFEELFQGVSEIQWGDIIPKNGAFPVKGYSLNSALFSVPDCQKIIKKAAVEKMKKKYCKTWFDETGAKYQIQFSIMKDEVKIFLDTSGSGLHKRGYRPVSNEAPLRETLAAAMVKLSRYRGRDVFLDPFCGSGTIAIEAAMIAKNIAPGMARSFDSEKWGFYDNNVWKDERQRAVESVRDIQLSIAGRDIDESCIELSKQNAKRAGVADYIKFEQADAIKTSYEGFSGTIVTNPPYGERLLDLRRAQNIYRGFGKQLKDAENAKAYIISSDPEFERNFGKSADKRRKLYNGMIQCTLYMYFRS